MAIAPLPTRDLLGVYRDPRLAAPSTYWRDLCFTGTPHQSTRQEIIFEKITARRRVAPFVRPQNTGKAIYRRQGSKAQLFTPAYIKPKDPVVPGEQFARQIGDLFTETPRTPEQNFQNEVGNVMAFHRETIDRRWEWMAAQAAIYGEVTVEYEDGPSVVVDFGRDAGHDVIKATGFWSDPDYPILDDIQAWADTMTVAEFGGIPNRLTVGGEVVPFLKKNKQIIEEMSNQRRGNPDIAMKTGLVLPGDRNANVRYLGTVGAGIDVYAYTDFYENDAGTAVPFLNPKDVVLTTPNVDGVMAFGAIVDVDANLQAMPVFPKMWKENDPSAMMIMTQSAPLPISVFPNRTFRSRVLDDA